MLRTQREMMMKTSRGIAPLYIRLRQHPLKEADHPWMHLQPKQHDVLAPWIIKIASPILHAAMWGKQDIDAEH
jgi:hypothetical protein